MTHLRSFGALLLLAGSSWTLALVPSARAWDQHHLVTRETLRGFELRDPALWRRLQTPVAVRPIEAFLAKAFGPTCTLKRARDRVLDGVGPGYEVRYTGGARYSMQLFWATGNSQALYEFLPGGSGPTGHAVGQSIAPAEVMTVYSDEPDWGMDDDVARLKDRGITRGVEGTGTRVLRHFWYENERQFSTDFNEGQELDRRFQAFYELSLIAFSVDEPYWGYRFLGNALHYLQDLTQPFHVKAVVSDKMVYANEVLRAGLCELRQKRPGGERCPTQSSLLAATIKSGWLVGTYHSIYEDLARGMLASDYRGTRGYVADREGLYERNQPVEALPLMDSGRGLLALRPAVQAAQRLVLPHVAPVAADLVAVFGNAYRHDPRLAEAEILLSGAESSVGYRLAVADFHAFPLSRRQQERKRALFDRTNELLQRAGQWGRAVVGRALDPATPQTEVLRLRVDVAGRCARD